jgi:deoxyribose-phosphate aldolase
MSSPNYLAAQNVLRKSFGIDTQKATTDVKSYLDYGAERVGVVESHQKAVCVPNFVFAKYIDHTLLKPEASREEIITLCNEAKAHGFASVCVNPHYVKLCATMLRNSDVKVCTVIGFPLGASTTRVKVYETQVACEEGAMEIDMVINIGELKSKNYDWVEADIASVVAAADSANAIVKVILETCLLTDEEKVIASVLSKNAGAHFVKTSTGFSKGGATLEDVALMRKAVGDTVGVKASGGVRDYATAKKMIEYGATRIGASASVKIVKEAKCL